MKIKKLLVATIISLCISALPALSEQYTDTAPSYYFTQGQEFYKNGQYSSAIREFRKALRENPDDSSSKIGLINAYISRAEYYNNTEKSPQKALSDLKSAVFYFVCFNGMSDRTGYSQAYSAAMTNLNVLENSLKADITGEGLVKTGKQLRTKGEFAAAGYDFYRALEDPVNGKDANSGLGDVLKILGQSKQSLTYYENALKLDPDNPDLRLKIARAYEDTGNYAFASEHYNFALKNSDEKEEILNSLEKICRQRVVQNPSDAEAHCNLGVIYQKRGNQEGALSEYQKSESLNPGSITTKINLGLLYYEQGKYKEAIATYNKALLIDPKNVQARLQKGKCFQSLSLWENATEEFKNALKYEPGNAEAQYRLAEVYAKTMSPDEVIKTLSDQGVNLSADFYSKMAYDYHKNKDINNAIKFYKMAIQHNAGDKSLYLNLGQIYNGRNDFTEALAYAELAKQQFPNDKQVSDFYNTVKTRYSGSLYDEASNLRDKGEYAAALQKYKNVQPQGFDSYIGIAGVYQLMKDYPNAVIFYKKALEIKPSDETVLLALAGIYIHQDNLNDAILILKKISNQNNPKVQELLTYINSQKSDEALNTAISKYEAKDYKNAETILTSLINQKLGGYMPHYYRAMVYDALGKYKEAVADYESVIAKDPSIALVYYSLGVDYDSLKNFSRAIQNYKKFLELTKEQNDYTNYAKQRIQQSK